MSDGLATIDAAAPSASGASWPGRHRRATGGHGDRLLARSMERNVPRLLPVRGAKPAAKAPWRCRFRAPWFDV
jgi:hypothetical protein